MKYGPLAVLKKNKSWQGMQLEQSQREGNVLVPLFVLLQLQIYCPPSSLGCCGAAGRSRGLCPACTRGVSHFRLQRCWNNAAAHQRAQQSPRDGGGEEDPWPHGSCGCLWGTESQCSQCSQLGASGQFGSSLADESGAQLQLSGQGTVLRVIPSGYSQESFCFQLFQLECSLGKHLWVLCHIQPRHKQHSSWARCCPALHPG